MINLNQDYQLYAHLLKEEHWLILAQTTHIYLYMQFKTTYAQKQ